MERHLNLNGRDTSTLPLYGFILKWGVSVVFIAKALRWVRVVTPAYSAGDNSYSYQFSVHNDETRKRERGIERLGNWQATTPHRPVKKRPRLLEAQRRKYAVSRTPQMAAQLGHFLLPKPRGEYKRMYSACHFPSLSILRSLSCFSKHVYSHRQAPYAEGTTRTQGVWRSVLVMKTTLTPHLRIREVSRPFRFKCRSTL